jgi:hypothetical protein
LGHVTARGIQHSLLGGGVGGGHGWQLGSGRVEKRGLIDEQLQGLRCLGAGLESRFEPLQSGRGEPFRKLDADDLAGDVRIRFVGGVACGQGSLQLLHCVAPGGSGGEAHGCKKQKENRWPQSDRAL